MKLNVRKWHHLECLGVMLASLASLLGAQDYLVSYQQDLRTPGDAQTAKGDDAGEILLACRA